MKMELTGSEEIAASRQQLWDGLKDPDLLTKCIPGCKEMTETAPDEYDVKMQLKVAAVGGSLGTGEGTAKFTITETGPDSATLDYAGSGEIGGLVAGVGSRVLGSVSKHLTKQFFTALKKQFAEINETT
tara:strand:+ start:8069 stop:8455 length:387 start_codon:yes stop_codon:yes gene_type:complete